MYGPSLVWSVLGMVILGLVVLVNIRSRYGPSWEWTVLGMVLLGMVVLGLVVLGLVSVLLIHPFSLPDPFIS